MLPSFDQRAERLRSAFAEELSCSLQQTEEERARAQAKWTGTRGLVTTLESRAAREMRVQCAGCRQPLGPCAEGLRREAWLCEGSERHRPRCEEGSHTGAVRYRCGSVQCTRSGLCERHFHAKRAALEAEDDAKFMDSFIARRGGTRAQGATAGAPGTSVYPSCVLAGLHGRR